jgi:hypothetical protein
VYGQGQGHINVRKKGRDGEPTKEGNGERPPGVTKTEHASCGREFDSLSLGLHHPNQDEPSGCRLYMLGVSGPSTLKDEWVGCLLVGCSQILIGVFFGNQGVWMSICRVGFCVDLLPRMRAPKEAHFRKKIFSFFKQAK